MKVSVKVIVCMVFLSVLITVPSALGQADKLVGVWKVSEVISTRPADQLLKPNAFMVLTKKHKFVLGVRSPRQELPENPTDTQLVAAWDPVWVFAHTHEVKGNTVITNAILAKNPNIKPGEGSTIRYKFEGEDLIWIMSDGFTLKYKRVE